MFASFASFGRAQAQEVPPYLAHQGRLLDALNAPLQGAQTLTFRLYDGPDATAAMLWEETQTLNLVGGYYSVILGETAGLDPAVFNGARRYLGVTVGGDTEELTPRLVIDSVAYALRAREATNATGDITPSSVTVGATLISPDGTISAGSTTIGPDGTISAGSTTIDSNGTISVGGNIVVDNAGQWVGASPSVAVGPGLAGDGTTANPLTLMACNPGQVLASDGSGGWACVDAGISYVFGLGLQLTGSNDLSVNTAAIQARVSSACPAGESIRQINIDGTIDCEADTDTDTTYSAGSGITITGPTNDIAVDTTTIQTRIFAACPPNESISAINADGSVACEPDTDTTYSAATGGGLILSGTNAFGIAADAIDSTRLADGAVATIDLADGAVTSAKILDGSILAADLAPNTIDSSKIVDGSIANADLSDASVTNAKLAADAVTGAKILDGSVAAADLAADAVTSAKILDGSVGTTDLANGAVTNAKLAADAVTSANILNGTVGAADINTAEVQRRVSGACTAGNSIRVVNADGTVTCEPDDGYTDAQAVSAVSAADSYVRNTGDTVAGNLAITGTLNVGGNVTGLTVTTANCAAVADACEIDGGELIYFDRSNDLACPANKVLVDWNVNNCGGGFFQLVFTCCDLVVQ